MEIRWAEGQFQSLPALAQELARRPVDVLVAGGGEPAAVAAKAATSTIPIVFAKMDVSRKFFNKALFCDNVCRPSSDHHCYEQ
jgi:ABC-type uncharacterized transport system substrate-binding protein